MNEAKQAAPRRGYSREFTLPAGDPGGRYMLDGIPSALLTAAKAKAAGGGDSLRAVLLRALEGWTAGRLALRSRRPKVAAAGRYGARPQRRPCAAFVPAAPGSVLWDVVLFGRRRHHSEAVERSYQVVAADYAEATRIAGANLRSYSIRSCTPAAALGGVWVVNAKCARCGCPADIHDQGVRRG